MTYYTSYRTRTFAEIFPNVTTLGEFYEETGLPNRLLAGPGFEAYTLSTIYTLLISRYASCPIKSSDENRFKIELCTLIMQYAPVWQKEMNMQDKILQLTDDELRIGSKAIYNAARNPGTAPSTTSLEELTYIDSQNTTQHAKGKGESFAALSAYIDDTVTERFLSRFAKLFVVVLYPDEPLLYTEEQ